MTIRRDDSYSDKRSIENGVTVGWTNLQGDAVAPPSAFFVYGGYSYQVMLPSSPVVSAFARNTLADILRDVVAAITSSPVA